MIAVPFGGEAEEYPQITSFLDRSVVGDHAG